MLLLCVCVGLRLANLLEMQTQSERISTSTDEYVRLTSLLFTSIPEQTDAGGAINMAGKGQLVLQSCQFWQMRSQGTGGAIYSKKERVTISGCTFEKCWAKAYGGGVHVEACNLKIEDTTFNGTSSDSSGGAVAVQSASAGEAKLVQLQRNTFDACSGGKSGECGGIVFTQFISQESKFVNNTFTGCSVNGAECACVWNVQTSGEVAISGNEFSDCAAFGTQFFLFDSAKATSCMFESCVFTRMSGWIACLSTTLRTTLDGCTFEYCAGDNGVVVLNEIVSTDPHQVKGCIFTDNRCDQFSESLRVYCDDTAPVVALTDCVFSDHTCNFPAVALSSLAQHLDATIKGCIFQNCYVGTKGLFTHNAGSGLYRFEGCVFRNIANMADSYCILQLSGSRNVQLDTCRFEDCQVSGYMVDVGSGTCQVSGSDFMNCQTVYGLFMGRTDELSLTGCNVSKFTVFSPLGVLNVTSGSLVLDSCQFVECENQLRGGCLMHVSSATLSCTNISLSFRPNARAIAIQIVSDWRATFTACAFSFDNAVEKIEAPMIEYTGQWDPSVTFSGCCFAHPEKAHVTSGSPAYLRITGAVGSVKITGCCFDLDKETSISSTTQPTYGEPGEDHMFVDCEAWCKDIEPEIPTETSEDEPYPGELTTSESSQSDPDSGKATLKGPVAGLIAGFVIAVLMLIGVLVLLFMVWRKRKTEKELVTERPEVVVETMVSSVSNEQLEDCEQCDNPLFGHEGSEHEFSEGFEETARANTR